VEPLSIEPGTVIAGRYRVHNMLGKGGMGEVFSAENTRTGRMVALKVLRSESKQKKSAVERFRREARAAGVIKSEFVTQVLDVEEDPEHGIVLVFELLEGESLVERLKRTGPISMVELWSIVEAVWAGLADAHAAGIVHRDLKPSNVFLETKSGTLKVKILDFGISKLPKAISTESLTQVGQSLGTFSFMPPEQIGRAKNVDHRADIYACTTLIFQGLSGKLPYQAKNVVAMMELKTKQDPRTLSEAMGRPVDAVLESFIAKGLARNPDLRFQTALEALTAWRTLRPAGSISVVSQTANEPNESWRAGEEDAKTMVMAKFSRADVLGAVGHGANDATTSNGGQSIPSDAYRSSPPREDPDPSTLSKPNPAPAHAISAASSPAIAVASAGGPTGTMMIDDEPPIPAATRVSQPAAVETHWQQRSPRKSGVRTFLTLALGAVGLMLVGFLAVALLMQLMK
jgi:serine/threonine-protein kinase